jgi:hypothetical protein
MNQNIGFREKKANIFAEIWQKSPKILIKTSTPTIKGPLKKSRQEKARSKWRLRRKKRSLRQFCLRKTFEQKKAFEIFLWPRADFGLSLSLSKSAAVLVAVSIWKKRVRMYAKKTRDFYTTELLPT